jgi:hypothetical protein
MSNHEDATMDRLSLAFARVCFFVMLFVSTACNRMDHGLLRAASPEERPAAVLAAADGHDAEVRSMKYLEAGVAELRAELRVAQAEERVDADIPGGANWD